MSNDEASVKGQGADIMLPARGNPFDPDPARPEEPDAVYAVGAEAGAPADELAPPEPAAPEPAPEPEPVMAAAEPAAPEPQDLSPEDLAAMFPASASDRGMGMGSDAELSAEDLVTATTLGADHDLPDHAPAAPEVVAAAPAMPVAAEAPAATAAGGAEAAVLSSLAGETIQVSPEDAIIQEPEIYKPHKALVAKDDLVKLFVPDNRLVLLWAEIDELENLVTTKVRGVSRRMAEELLDHLTSARNYLMNDRANFEEAQREVAEVRYRMSRAIGADVTQQPRFLLFFQLFMLAVIVLGFRFTNAVGASFGGTIAGSDFALVWSTLLWGGIGGVTGALYGLWVHVAQKQDYDPQFALWYYSNPLMGFLLGGLAFLLIKLGMGAATGGQTIDPAPYTFYVLAFAVGFQQNLAFSLLNNTLKKLIPQEGRTPEPPARTKKSPEKEPAGETPAAGK